MMAGIPAPLEEIIKDFLFLDRNERADLLIEYADRFQEVAPDVATRPFGEEHHVLRCESDAYVWATDNPDGTLKFHFAVENPQGLSAKAWSVILGETLSGQPLDRVAAVPEEAVFQVFGKDISMGKGQGLVGILNMVVYFAKRKLAAKAAAQDLVTPNS